MTAFGGKAIGEWGVGWAAWAASFLRHNKCGQQRARGDSVTAKRLLLIDGFNVLFRSFHALPPLTTSDGRPSGAIYGFCQTLMRLTNDVNPSHIICAGDRPEPSFRHQTDPDYKAHRPATPYELVPQLQAWPDVLAGLQIAMLSAVGYEADDVLATCARRAEADRFARVVIVSSDRDLLQIVSPTTSLYLPGKTFSDFVVADEEYVATRYEGLCPDQMVDYKVLVGDPSDNLPGVNGIGPKTAGKLLTQWQTLDAVVDNIDKLDARLRERLRELADDLPRRRAMVRLRTDVPVRFKWDEVVWRGLATASVRQLFATWNFNSLLKRVGEQSSQPTMFSLFDS